MKLCPKCNCKHEKSGIFCSYSCANTRIIFSNEEVLCEDSSYPRHRLKERLIKQKLIAYECQECGNSGEHNGKPLVLQLDHINGVNNDNRLVNLRFLCPNCHTQQDTYAAKNKGNTSRKCYGSTTVSKTVSVGSTPTRDAN